MKESLHFSEQSCSTSLRAAGLRIRFRNCGQVFWLALTMSAAAALLAPTETSAQLCRGNPNIGCTNAGAVCSPVQVGIGSSGHCTTTPGLPPGERTCECVGTSAPALATSRAYVLIETTSDKEAIVRSSLGSLANCKALAVTLMPAEIVAHVECNDLRSLSKVVTEEIPSKDGVKRATLWLVINRD